MFHPSLLFIKPCAARTRGQRPPSCRKPCLSGTAAPRNRRRQQQQRQRDLSHRHDGRRRERSCWPSGSLDGGEPAMKAVPALGDVSVIKMIADV